MALAAEEQLEGFAERLMVFDEDDGEGHGSEMCRQRRERLQESSKFAQTAPETG
jgi:hypothetical protein